jgi:hypothetical protein
MIVFNVSYYLHGQPENESLPRSDEAKIISSI